MRGEVIADALLKVFVPKTWELVDVDNAKKWRLVPGDEPIFRTRPTLNSVGDMCKFLRFDPTTVSLDEGEGVEMVKNFRGE